MNFLLAPAPAPTCLPEQVQRYEAGVHAFEFDVNLAPYDLRSYGAWRELSAHITENVVTKVSPVRYVNGRELPIDSGALVIVGPDRVMYHCHCTIRHNTNAQTYMHLFTCMKDVFNHLHE